MNEKEAYFQWLVSLIDVGGIANRYCKLLDTLNHIVFYYSRFPELDGDRVGDGKWLRWSYSLNNNLEYDDTPCASVLEVMVGTVVRGELHIMQDNAKGDRTPLWFWSMIKSLGLIDYTDDNFKQNEVNDIVLRFLKRDYKPNGEGGLFTVSNPTKDMREVDIWQQMCMWFSEILEKEGFFE